VDRERIELSISGCKPDVFPLALTARNLVGCTGIEPVVPEDGGFTVHCITIDAYNPYRNNFCRRFCYAGNDQDLKEIVFILAGDARIELATTESKSVVIPFHQSPTIKVSSYLFSNQALD
jgi:hypothetical protein